MKSLLSVLALAFGALTFQSCEYYPNGASRGYYHGDHSGDGYYDGGYFLKSSCLLPNAHIGSPA
jgi:hypothetical protein